MAVKEVQKMTTESLNKLFSSETISKIFPENLADQFFDAFMEIRPKVLMILICYLKNKKIIN